MKKVVLITNIPTPYRVPLFNVLEKMLGQLGFKLKVLFMAKQYERRKWHNSLNEAEFDYAILKSWSIKLTEEKYFFIPTDLFRVLLDEKPVAIITGGFSISTVLVLLFHLLKDVPYAVWSGETARPGQRISILRTIIRKTLVMRSSALVAYGTKAKEYLISLGAWPETIEIAVNTVDTYFYREQTERLRRRMQLDDEEKHLLYIGHLSRRKSVLKILKAIKNLSSYRTDFMLDVVGDGEERLRLEHFVIDNRLDNFVKFHGFKQKNEIPKFMAQAACFLFQTDFDIWGLALVEAMAAGLPCLASIHAGATSDLIEEGVTGFAMDFSEIEKVTEKIDWILKNPESARKIGENASRFIVENVNLEKSAQGFVKAIMKTLKELIHA